MIYHNESLLLKVDNLSLAIGGNLILHGVDFEIYDTIQPDSPVPRGQVVAMLAPSGTGKTVLFRCIAGILAPTTGNVFINGNKRQVRQGEVGVVYQDYPLIETRTVLGNLVRAYRVAKLCASWDDTKEATAAALGYLERFGLSHVAKHYPCQLSGGQRQRVAIAQQMLCSRHFLLLDEPFSGLDIIAKTDACNVIAAMAAADELNSIIVTTHDIRMACACADRVLLLGRDRSGGQVVPGARIMADYDLKALDLCWIPGITLTEPFMKFVASIEERFHDL